MSRPNPHRPMKDRPPLPTPGTNDASPPVPKPRGRGGGVRQPSANLPTWPPPSADSSPGPPSLPPSRLDQRAPAPLPPTATPAAPSPSSSRPPAPQTHGHAHGSAPSRPPPPLAHPEPAPSLASPPPPASPSSPRPNKNHVAFGTCLQEAHDAINKRHEDELHALESFRAHVFFRAKADREYAQELGKINARATKTLASVSQPSAIVQVQLCPVNANTQ